MNYEEEIQEKFAKCYSVAGKAREKGFDPSREVEIIPADDVASRVEGLVGPPEISKKIRELSKSKKREEVIMQITDEILEGKWPVKSLCDAIDEREIKIEQAVRTGLALYTEGVVSAPIEGVVRLKLKKNADGSEYLAVSFSGPIRGAGGTGQAFTLLLADYCRKKMGVSEYRPLEVEVDRYVEEINLYAVRTRSGQYTPTEDEVRHIIRNCAVCIDGEPTEEYEVTVNKNVPNVDSNRIRGGAVLVISEGICLKAAKIIKLYKKIPGIEWSWIEKLIKVTKKEATKFEIKPDFKYLKDIVAGRPIFSYPSRQGGFTLRYGRTRLTGIASKAIHPATMTILDSFPAIGTQVKLERPAKACVVTPCEEIDGPLVKLKNGNVTRVKTNQQAKELLPEVEKIIFLGDLLINYGDFLKANHPLIQSSWCSEWYAEELKEKGIEKTKKECEKITFHEALQYANEGVPLAPKYTLFWSDFKTSEINELVKWMVEKGKLSETLALPLDQGKKELLENLGLEHKVQNEKIILNEDETASLLFPLGMYKGLKSEKWDACYNEDKNILEILKEICGVEIKNRAGNYIGASMGRPEKSKERRMQPAVHGLFPIGNYGGKIRSIAKAVKNLKNKGERVIQVETAIRMCPSCKIKTPLRKCSCSKNTIIARQCSACGSLCVSEKCPKCKKRANESERQVIDLIAMHSEAVKNVSTEDAKGVIGLISSRKVFEIIEKALLRSKHSVYVFRDGTTRIDATEIPITHFIPQEIETNLKKLKELGYTKDVHGEYLENEDQVVELKPQDMIINKKSAEYMLRIANFIDDLLIYVYGLPAHYNAKTIDDLIGQLTICIAPHISAGITTRIIGFTTSRALLAHPYIHCACRRNCLSAKSLVYYKNDKKMHCEEFEKMFEKHAATNILENDREMEIVKLVGQATALGTDEFGNYQEKKIKQLIRRPYRGQMQRIICENNQEIEVTPEHRLWIMQSGKLVEKRAMKLNRGDELVSLAKTEQNEEISEINLIKELENHAEVQNITVRTSKEFCQKVKENIGGRHKLKQELNVKDREISNWMHRGKYAIPLPFYLKIRGKIPQVENEEKKFKVGFKRNFGEVNAIIPINEKLGEFLGLYVSEGWCWKSKVKGKESYHIGIAAQNSEVRKKAANLITNLFGVKVTESAKDVVLTNKILCEFIGKLGGKTAHEKFVPELILNSDRKTILGFLAGCYQGDGCIDKREIKYATVSEKLASQLYFILTRLGMCPTFKNEKNKKITSGLVFEKYKARGKLPPEVTLHYVCLYSEDTKKFAKEIKLIGKKQEKLNNLLKNQTGKRRIIKQNDVRIARVKEIETFDYNGFVYDIELDGTSERIFSCGKGMLLSHNCDGDEIAYMLLLDALVNFSREFLPATRGGQMDAPLVLSSKLNPQEVDDEVHAMDVCEKYPLEFYQAAQRNASPSEVKLDTVANRLGTNREMHDLHYTHACVLDGPIESAYVSLGNMREKVAVELEMMKKIRAVDASGAAERIISSHFFPDLYGNLRSFGKQIFRCVDCNSKFRRVPLRGKCARCGGKLILTINRGGIEKYLELSKKMAEDYKLPLYLKQRLLLIEKDIKSLFEDDTSKQFSLAEYV